MTNTAFGLLLGAYCFGSAAILRVIIHLIVENEYMSWREKTWRATASFVCWPLLWGLVLVKATVDFFWKGTYPQ